MKAKKQQAVRLLAVSAIRGVAGPGLNSSLGMFFSSVAAALGVGVGAVSWSVGIASAAGMLFLPLAARMYERCGVRITALAGVLLVGLSYLANGFASHLVWWYVWAVPFGIGTVLVVNLLGPLVLDGEGAGFGSALGKMMTFAGVAAVPVQPLVAWALSRGGSRAGYVWGGASALVVMLPCLFTLPRKKHVQQVPDKQGETGIDKVDFFLIFWLLFVIVGVNSFHQHLTTLGESYLLGAGMIGTALTLSMTGAAVGGLVLGYVTRRYSAAMGGYLTILLGASAVLLLLPMGRMGAIRFISAAFLHGLSSAAIGITAQTLLRERCVCGYGSVLSKLLVAIPLGNLLLTPLWGMIYDRTGRYTIALLGMLGLLTVGTACLFGLQNKRKKVLSQ